MVFFDFLGLCLVHYPEWAGMLLNLLVIGSVLYAAVDRARHSYRYVSIGTLVIGSVLYTAVDRARHSYRYVSIGTLVICSVLYAAVDRARHSYRYSMRQKS